MPGWPHRAPRRAWSHHRSAKQRRRADRPAGPLLHVQHHRRPRDQSELRAVLAVATAADCYMVDSVWGGARGGALTDARSGGAGQVLLVGLVECCEDFLRCAGPYNQQYGRILVSAVNRACSAISCRDPRSPSDGSAWERTHGRAYLVDPRDRSGAYSRRRPVTLTSPMASTHGRRSGGTGGTGSAVVVSCPPASARVRKLT
jgi:hypothetical protein